MKKLLILLVAHLAIVASATQATAQKNFIVQNTRQKVYVPIALVEAIVHASTHTETVSARVSKKFIKQFARAAGAVWTKTNNGFVVYFTAKGIQNRVFLTRHGKYQSSIRYYSEKELPAAISQQIKRTYYDFAITSVMEVHQGLTTVYLVTIADAATWKVIHVLDGELTVWKEYVKG